MILLIDNYDSFSYNLYQLIGETDPDIKVIRNDELNPDEIKKLCPEKIVISPGPGRPENAGYSMEIVKELGATVPILGVCLGHQAICAAFGASITYAKKLMHGKASPITFDETCPLFKGCPQSMTVARYHSLAAKADTIPDCLQVVAQTDDREIMAVKHKTFPIYGLQFHPESILTPYGKTLMQNFQAVTAQA